MVARQCGCTSGDLGKLTIPPQSTFWTILLLKGLLGDYLLDAASAAEGTAAVRFLFHLPPPLLTIPRTGIDIVQLSRLHFWQASYSSSRQLTPVCYNQVQGMLLRGLAPFSLPDWFPLRRHDHPSGDHSSGDTPLVLGALRPARGLLVVSLPCSSRLLYLEVWPNNFYSYSVIWSALYLLAMELVSLGFQPSPRYSSLTPLEFYLAFSDIEAILDAPSSWPICCSAT